MREREGGREVNLERDKTVIIRKTEGDKFFILGMQILILGYNYCSHMESWHAAQRG